MDYKTDGELYDACLTASLEERALNVYRGIIDIIDTFGFITICDIVQLAGEGVPKNWRYASTHGWSRSDVSGFTIKHDESKGWQIFLGNPRILADSEKSSCEPKKYLVVLSPRTKVPEDGQDTTLVNIRLYVYAPDAKEARKAAIKIMESHRLYCKVTYIRELKGETK
jgi:hypothetical protein